MSNDRPVENRAGGPNATSSVLLVLPPYWTPAIPPLGIACLKAYLKPRGIDARIADANVQLELLQPHAMYLAALKSAIPAERRANFSNLVGEVLMNHLAAHVNRTQRQPYVDVVRRVVRSVFWTDVDATVVDQLAEILDEFFARLQRYTVTLLEEVRPTLVGLTAFGSNVASAVAMTKFVKAFDPRIVTVLGGGVFSNQLDPKAPEYQAFLDRTPTVDKLILGEGEELLAQFLEGRLPEGQRVFELKDIAKKTIDVSQAPLPDFSDLVPSDYPVLGSWTSRSCPFQCTFCAETVQWGEYRKKPGPQILDECRELWRRHGRQLFLFGDSLLNPVIADISLAALADEKAGRPPVYFDGYLRADKHVCLPKNTFLWRRAGYYRARLGLESGSLRILEQMKKMITPAQIHRAVSALASAGIKTTTYWICGYPGETEEAFQETLDLVTALKNDIWEADCTPFTCYPAGQVASDQWDSYGPVVPVFPPKDLEHLYFQSWDVDCYPGRREAYARVCRFVEHCRKLGIPNPYSMAEIHEADERWARLHANAVPALVDFLDEGSVIDECRGVVIDAAWEQKAVRHLRVLGAGSAAT